MQTITLDFTNMSTDELENFIDSRYEAGALQEELNFLETVYAGRISEDELNMTEEDIYMREALDMGVDLDEWLAKEYYEYTHPHDRCGGREDKDYFIPSTFNEFTMFNLKTGVSRKDIMAAARDVYEYKMNLIQRYRSKNKLFNIPSSLWPKR